MKNIDINIIHNIVMADLAGPDIQGGTDMTDVEKQEVFEDFKDIITKAYDVGDYFKTYIEADIAKQNMTSIDDIV